jgi:RNA recognition motif-containing protein
MAKCIYVGNLPVECTAQDLAALFQPYGGVDAAMIAMDSETYMSRGFGYVEMGDDEAQRAIAALDRAEFRGRPLEVRETKPRWEHGPKCEWRLIDMTDPFGDPYSDEDNWRYTAVGSEDQLIGDLRRQSQAGPRCLVLEHSTGEKISLNVRPVYSAVSWPVPSHPGKELSAIPAQTRADTPESFKVEGLWFDIPPEHLLTTGDAIEIVRHFYRTRRLPDWVKWE